MNYDCMVAAHVNQNGMIGTSLLLVQWHWRWERKIKARHDDTRALCIECCIFQGTSVSGCVCLDSEESMHPPIVAFVCMTRKEHNQKLPPSVSRFTDCYVVHGRSWTEMWQA